MAHEGLSLVRWSVRSRGRLLDCGEARGAERDVLERLLRGELWTGAGKAAADQSYSLTAGAAHASAYGDELTRVAELGGNMDDLADERGHLFSAPEAGPTYLFHPVGASAPPRKRLVTVRQLIREEPNLVPLFSQLNRPEVRDCLVEVWEYPDRREIHWPENKAGLVGSVRMA